MVGQGNQIGDIRFLFSPLTTPPLWPPKREYNAVSAERSMKFGNIVRVETLRHLTKITALRRKADREGSCSLAYGFATITMYVGGNQARLDARTEFEILEPSPKGGVEAGRAHHCRASRNKLEFSFLIVLFDTTPPRHLPPPFISSHPTPSSKRTVT